MPPIHAYLYVYQLRAIDAQTQTTHRYIACTTKTPVTIQMMRIDSKAPRISTPVGREERIQGVNR
jgi:hypothetical protein